VTAETEFDVSLSVPALPQLVGIVPPIRTPVILPPASRFHVPVAGDAAVLVARHVIAKIGSLIWKATPTTLNSAAVMFGSVPVNPA